METKTCKCCGKEFKGRINRLYCSIRCKSEVGNKRWKNKHAASIEAEKQFRANERALATVFMVLGKTPVNSDTIRKAGYNETVTGIADKDGGRWYGSYGLIKYDKNKFLVIKK